jgi:hypothetical protein
MTDILALDIATTTGFARGHVGDIPECSSVDFAHLGVSDNAILGKALYWFSELLRPAPRPDLLVIEAMLPPLAKVGNTNRKTRDRLAGLHGIFIAVAHLRGIHEITTVEVGAVRQHFIHARNLRGHIAKQEVMEKCRALGWRVPDHNAADAAALWHFACSLIKPELALEASPLFRRRA